MYTYKIFDKSWTFKKTINVDLVKYLLKNGAYIDLKDDAGDTAIDIANQHDELKYFVDSIYAQHIDISSNVKLHDIVIISRNNSTLQKIEAALAEKRVPTYYLETIQDNQITRENIQRIKNRNDQAHFWKAAIFYKWDCF